MKISGKNKPVAALQLFSCLLLFVLCIQSTQVEAVIRNQFLGDIPEKVLAYGQRGRLLATIIFHEDPVSQRLIAHIQSVGGGYQKITFPKSMLKAMSLTIRPRGMLPEHLPGAIAMAYFMLPQEGTHWFFQNANGIENSMAIPFQLNAESLTRITGRQVQAQGSSKACNTSREAFTLIIKPNNSSIQHEHHLAIEFVVNNTINMAGLVFYPSMEVENEDTESLQGEATGGREPEEHESDEDDTDGYGTPATDLNFMLDSSIPLSKKVRSFLRYDSGWLLKHRNPVGTKVLLPDEEFSPPEEEETAWETESDQE